MAVFRSRSLPNNSVILDQADFFQPDGFSRVTGLLVSDLTLQVFFNNLSQAWTLVNGAGITDAQVASGYVYWSEIPTIPGTYNVRLRPNAVGYWRILITYTAGMQITGQEYDITSIPSTVDQGLRASFSR